MSTPANPDDQAFEDIEEAPVVKGAANHITPTGYQKFRDELNDLVKVQRPDVVETVSWAAGNGDRSENGDYIYGKKRLREIDRRIRFLSRRLKHAVVVDPELQANKDQVFFGAKVTYVNDDDVERTVTIVGKDEADLDQGCVSVMSPIARSLMKAVVGDVVDLLTPGGVKSLEILKIEY
jgi:transcription elongation factor GreB